MVMADRQFPLRWRTGRQVCRRNCHRATHPRATSQTDDTRYGQLSDGMDHYAKKPFDVLILKPQVAAQELQMHYHACHSLTTTHTHSPAATLMLRPLQVSHACAQAARPHPRASRVHPVDNLHLPAQRVYGDSGQRMIVTCMNNRS